MSKVLDIGCGPHCLPGATGLDIKSYPGVSVVHDMNKGPWPFADAQFTHVRCQHVIEHVRELQVFAREIYRVCASGATIDFITPHYSSYASWGDPTHIWHFALASIPILFEQELGSDKFVVTKQELKFTGALFDFPGWCIYKLSRKRYEKHFAWIYPCNEIHVSLKFVK